MKRSINPCLSSPRKLALMLSSLGIMTAVPAAAAVVDGLSAQATAQVTGNSAANDGPNSSIPFTSAYAYQGVGDSSASASSFGRVAGPYGAGGDGVGSFDSTGHFVRSWSITNDSGVAQHYAFDFYIYYGSLSAYDYGAGGSGYGEYAASIVRDGTSTLFSSTAKIASDGTLTTSGTILDGATKSGSAYWWGGTHFTVDLGILNNGDSTHIDYDLIGHAFGDYGFTSSCGSSGYGYGYGDSSYGYGGACTGSAHAFLGDPDQLNTTPIPGLGVRTVPEPGTLGLLGAGLMAGLGFRRRRHRD